MKYPNYSLKLNYSEKLFEKEVSSKEEIDEISCVNRAYLVQ